MSKEVICCKQSEDLEAAIKRMAFHQIRRLPVVDSDERIVDMLSLADIALSEDDGAAGFVLTEVSEPIPRLQVETVAQ